MTPSFFLTICLGGILCLTPLAVYLLWLAAVNRRERPTIVAASWDFTALLVGLGGFLFCTGVIIATAVVDSGLFTHGSFARLAAWLPWMHPAALLSLTLYLLLLARAIRKGLAERRHTLSAFNVDEASLEAAVDKILRLSGSAATKSGSAWLDGTQQIIELTPFPIFRHVTVKLQTPIPALRQSLESELRLAVPKLPGAAENPAAPWIASAATCALVTVGCSVALIFALPFLR